MTSHNLITRNLITFECNYYYYYYYFLIQPVGAALLDTLEKGLGEKFTAEVKEAWTVVYGIVADTMKAGAREVLEG